MMISDVRGNFPAFQGRVVLDEGDITRSTVEVSIEAASIDTRHAKRDAHLKSPDFFDVEKYPVITFKSNKITRGSAGTFEVVGALTLHGVTRDVELTVSGPSQSMKDPWGNIRKGVRATTQVNRKDFDLTWNKALETGGVLVGESIDIVIELELIQQKG
jgi:polyisoprenoid-binding protein YceI